jgi:hypothetical protein
MLGSPMGLGSIMLFIPLKVAADGGCVLAGGIGPGAVGGMAMFAAGTGFFLTYFRLVVEGSLSGFFLGLPRFLFGGSESPSMKKFWLAYGY